MTLPHTVISYTSRGSTSPSAQTSDTSEDIVSCTRIRNAPSASGSIIVAEIRVITSAPNGCWRFSSERTATGCPLSRSSSVATTVVVPTSKAIANRRAVVSPGSNPISSWSATTAVTSQFDARSTDPSDRSTSIDACGSKSSSASSTRWRSERWSSIEGSSRTRWRFCTAGRRMTWRPTPASAAFGRVCSGGTSTTRSPRAEARHASRHPSRSSSALNARGSSGPTGTSPDTMRTRHFLQVPCPPHVESIAIPFQLAASNTGVPLGTRTSAPSGRNRRRTRCAPSSSPGSGVGEAASPPASPRRRCGKGPLTTPAPPGPPSPAERDARRSSSRPTRRGPAGDRSRAPRRPPHAPST